MSSRFYKIGSIYSRVNGFIRKGFVKFEERPLWYDVYAHFPPKYEPKFSRQAPVTEINDIFYTEDVIRSKIHKKYSHKLGVYNLSDESQKTNCQRWIESYNELKAQGMSEDDALMQLEDLIEKSHQDLVFHSTTHTQRELSSPLIPPFEIVSKPKKDDIDATPAIKTISKPDVVDENLDEDIIVDETIEVSSPVIPIAKMFSKVDEKKKDSE